MGPGCNTREIADKLIDLKAEIEDLDRREQELDQQRVWVQQSIQNVTDDIENSRYPLTMTPIHSPTLSPFYVQRHTGPRCIAGFGAALSWVNSVRAELSFLAGKLNSAISLPSHLLMV